MSTNKSRVSFCHYTMTIRNMKIYSLDRRSVISEKDSDLFKGMKNTKNCKNNIDKYKENKGFPLKSTLQTNNDLKQKNTLSVNVCMFIILCRRKIYNNRTKTKRQEKMKYRINIICESRPDKLNIYIIDSIQRHKVLCPY